MAEVVLQTEGLTKRYGDLVAVDGLSLTVYRGEVLGFLGPNGAGKTTAINMLCGLLPPDAGRVLIDGQPVQSSAVDIRARVGVCPQEIVLWGRLTCLEQLQFIGQMYGLAGRTARERGKQLLADLGLDDKRDQQARALSGGMQRRLNLALALVHDPAIVVLDEPEAGLDPQSRVKVREYIQTLAAHKTVILTTHNMDEADRLADRVAIIDHGRLLVLDTPERLKQGMGAGDVVEITLPGPVDPACAEVLRGALRDLAEEVGYEAAHGLLSVRALHAVRKLPAILTVLAEQGLTPGDVRLRENTLEDVFIQLTGRRLRA